MGRDGLNPALACGHGDGGGVELGKSGGRWGGWEGHRDRGSDSGGRGSP